MGQTQILRVPKFRNIEEEAEFWDKTDTSEILRTGECVKVEWDLYAKFERESGG